LTQFNEDAKKSFLAQRFADALRLYDEGVQKTFDDHPQSLAALLQVASDSLNVGGDDPTMVDSNATNRAAVIAAFILRLKPFYFDAAQTYVAAMTRSDDAASTATDAGVKAARVVLKHHLAKDGTDAEAKKLLDSLAEKAEKRGDESSSSPASLPVREFLSPPDALPDIPADFATALGNALNNSALCELKLKRYEAAAASASHALLFLSAADARAKATFRHAQALLRCCCGDSDQRILTAEEAEALTVAAERDLKKAEVKVLRGILAEAKGGHDWASYLKECLKDDKKVVEPVEFLNSKIAVGNSKTKGLGLVAKDAIKKGEILCVQHAVHYVPPKAAVDSEQHLDFPKTLLSEVLKDARNEAALRVLGHKGQQVIDEAELPTIGEVFRRAPIHLPHLRDQLLATQIKDVTKKRGGNDLPLQTYQDSPAYEAESRRLASLVSDVVKKMSRQSTSLALSFDVRYKKTMTQTGGDPELGQLGLWPIPSLLHHAEFPNVTYGTMGGVAIVTAIRDIEPGTPLSAMMGGIQCLPERLRHLTSMGISFAENFDPDHPLTPTEATIVEESSAVFAKANDLKMDTVGMDPGEAKPVFEKAIDACLECIEKNRSILERADPLGLAALYFTMADCLGGKKELSGMVKAYFMGIQSAHSAIVVSLDTLTRMTKMQKFIPMAKKLEEIQDQAEMVAKNNPSLQEEFKKIARVKEIGPSVGKIQDYLEENLAKGCEMVFSTKDAFRLLS